MIDVLMLTLDDNANTGWKTFKCLQRLGLTVQFLKGDYHPFGYPEQGCVHPALVRAAKEQRLFVDVPELHAYANQASVIHYVASCFVDTGVDLSKCGMVMQHGGRNYRQYYEVINKNFNGFVDYSLVQMPDLLGLGAKNEVLFYFPVDTDFIKPVYKRFSDKLVIGHFPTLSTNKGTTEVVKVMDKLRGDGAVKDKFIYCGVREAGEEKIMLWTDNLLRMSECDVIVDVFAKTAQGKPYGEWGNVSFEAAALGKIPVSMSLKKEVYEREYGECGIKIANTEEELEEVLRRLICLKVSDLQKEKETTRDWVNRNHGFEASAKRLWDKVYCNFFGGNV